LRKSHRNFIVAKRPFQSPATAKMRLLVHNLLQCTASSTNKSSNCKPSLAFPLKIQNLIKITRKETEFNRDFINSLILKIDYPALLATLKDLQINLPNLPESLPSEGEEELENDKFLQDLHVALLETEIEEADLVCEGCGQSYPIRDGIVNMLLNQ
jgi:multifunctional methyltransferase subunit TRM112